MEKILMDEHGSISHEIETYKWWSKIRWFFVLILFAIGILRVTQPEQTYPIIIFVITFLGISVLNILFHLQIIKTNIFFSSLQILLDIIFATVVVHLTGGLNSSFVWVYLIAVITASLTIDDSGGIIAAIIGSLSLLALVILYNFGWVIPVYGLEFNADIPTQTIFLISYTCLFCGIAFISSHISSVLKQYSISSKTSRDLLNEQKIKLSEKKEELTSNSKLLEKYREVVHESAIIAGLDHDLNNPLTIISLSIQRILKASHDYKDEKLEKSATQMSEAINSINEILFKFQKLKELDLIQKERNK